MVLCSWDAKSGQVRLRNVWRFGQPEGSNSPLLESFDNDLSLDTQFGNLSEIVTEARYQGLLNRVPVYHHQELLDLLVNGFQGSEVGSLGLGVGVVLVNLRGELIHLGRQLVNGESFQRDTVHLPSDETSFPRKEDQVTPSLCASAASSANTMDVDVGRGWHTDLDNSCHSWVIDTSGRDIAGY